MNMTDNYYSPDYYDRNLVLKVPFLLMVILLFSVRHLFMVFLAYNPSPKLADAFTFMQHVASPYFVLADLPAMLVLAAWIRRAPKAGDFVRRVWRHGRTLLTVSLITQFAILVYMEGAGVWTAYFYGERERMVIVSMGLNGVALYLLWRFPLFGDVFADFPKADAADSGAASSRPEKG